MRRRILSWSGVGTALAAMIVLGVFVWTPAGRGGQSRVQADEIFAGLRDAFANAFKVTFSNFSTGTVKSSGTVIVKGLNTGAAGPTHTTGDGAYIDLHLDGVTGSDADGLVGDARLCFMGGDHWAYVKARNVPESIRSGEPLIGWLADRSENGLFIRIPKDASTANAAASPEDAATDTQPASVKRTFTISLGGSSGGGGSGVHAGIQSAEVDALVAQAESSHNGSGLIVQVLGEHSQYRQLLERLLTGQATADDLNQLVTAIQQSAGNVSVTQTEPGLSVLTASDFILPDGDTADGSSAGGPSGGTADDAVLQIAYREGRGVEWAQIDRIGPTDGSVRFERTDVADNDPRFDGGQYENDAGVRKFGGLDWLTLMGLLQSSGNAGQSGESSAPAESGN